MSTRNLSIPELRRAGFRALIERLGPADALRFLQQFDPGTGDYTKERAKLLQDVALDELLREIDERRQSA